MTVAASTRCTGCGACLITCPVGALAPARGRPVVDDGRCTDCLACIEVCPVDAVTFRPGGPTGDLGRRD